MSTEPKTWNPGQTIADTKFSRTELELMAEHYRAKATAEQATARHWQGRALLAEAQLSTLRAEYEPEGLEPCS
ncbi:hypothetical protein [Crystallibacter degradans]|uniref:hypothetical protein n=1 Tax=Crystallibacter degradans TaxID=2726743 RepID=UPI0014749E8A|nr:hypothetical protein [Arthrobacter sp. SF27]NMR29936.1 hypothetical protein [Arthrobacter sp. SF27]